MLDIAVASRSETGQRDTNEDKVRVCREGPRWLAVVADGAGGHVGGAEASRRTVDHLETALHEGNPPFTADALTAAVLSAHADVLRAQPGAEGLGRMHSTVVVLWVDVSTERALWSHVGDSRLYRARHGRVDLLTADDSVVQRMVDAGLLTQQQALVHPQKNQLIAALGIDDAVDPHTVARPVAIEEGDAFLLCSDGWWGALEPGCIASTLSQADSPEEWLAAMRREIERQAAPHQDNFSAIGVWVGDLGEATRPMAAG
ncbi:protein phosphatase 2C domain-containing protein [Piscinibacter sp. XHJ-5]|uniref:PP2C family protein-serine/threonine phosphatase n=1 Tax=Piscinibacter sp. XHJ-5 TaxID=3037797 RepID=UPI00245338C7|nr:protein phosphatase 2C domain-containing protein [Piscinibacter sp. XHJ-5]